MIMTEKQEEREGRKKGKEKHLNGGKQKCRIKTYTGTNELKAVKESEGDECAIITTS